MFRRALLVNLNSLKLRQPQQRQFGGLSTAPFVSRVVLFSPLPLPLCALRMFVCGRLALFPSQA